MVWPTALRLSCGAVMPIRGAQRRAMTSPADSLSRWRKNEARGAQPSALNTYSLLASAFFRGLDGRTHAAVACHFPDFGMDRRHASLARRHVAACKPRRRSWLW